MNQSPRFPIPIPGPGLLGLRPAAVEFAARHGITAAISFRHGRCVWVVLRTEGTAVLDSRVGSSPTKPTRSYSHHLNDIRGAVAQLQGTPAVPVFTMTEDLGELLRATGVSVSPLFPPAAATAVLEQMVLAHTESMYTALTLATDASAGRVTGWRGHGWVMDFGLASGPVMGLKATQHGSVLEAELRSIHLGLLAARTRFAGTMDGRCPVTVQSDSQMVLRFLADPSSAPKALPAACRSEVACIRAVTANAQLSYEWVKGHGDNMLNNAADRLAVLARRAKEAGLTNTERNHLLAGIAETAFVERTRESVVLAA